MRGWVKAGLALAALAGMASCAGGALAAPPAPSGSVALPRAAVAEAAKALDDTVTAYLRGEYRISGVQFYGTDAQIPWIALVKQVQSSMGMRKPKSMQWHRTGIDLVQLYPANGKAFLVAMSREPMADGRKLVGYYTLVRP